SHLGRPDGKPNPKYSLRPVAARFAELLGRPVSFDEPGEIELLENLRFDPGEGTNDPEFARRLAAHGDVYINDAFARTRGRTFPRPDRSGGSRAARSHPARRS